MMPRTTGTHAQCRHIVHEAEAGIGVVELLGWPSWHRTHLGGKGFQVALRRLGLGMHLGVGRHLDVEVITVSWRMKRHQFAGVVEPAAHAATTGQVATQGHQALDAHGLERGQLGLHGGARGADAEK